MLVTSENLENTEGQRAEEKIIGKTKSMRPLEMSEKAKCQMNLLSSLNPMIIPPITLNFVSDVMMPRPICLATWRRDNLTSWIKTLVTMMFLGMR